MTAPLGTAGGPCRNCPARVIDDERGGWVHTGGAGYQCRDDANVLLPGMYAQPRPHQPPRPEWPINRWTGRHRGER